MRFLLDALQWLFTVVVLKIIVAHWIANQIMKRSDTINRIVKSFKEVYQEELSKVRQY